MFRYIGSKVATADMIVDLVQRRVRQGTVADAFGGLGTIGCKFKQKGYAVTTTDTLLFPHFFQIARIERNSMPLFSGLQKSRRRTQRDIEFDLNNSYAPASWFVKEFSDERYFFQRSNAIRIAGAWHKIKKWTEEDRITTAEKAVLIASLLNSMDFVANTAGTYYAYLRNWTRKAKKEFTYKLLRPNLGNVKCKALLGDALEVLDGSTFDILYLDPPYTSRDYGRYYHLPESLAMLQRPVTPASLVSGVPARPTPLSLFSRPAYAIGALQSLVLSVKWKLLVLQYSEDALMPLKEIRRFLSDVGFVSEVRVSAPGYTTSKKARNVTQTVFLVSHSATTA